MTITGKYQLVSSDNFEEYMKAVGVGLVMRKMAANATPVAEITQKGDEWNIKTSTTFKTTEIKFKLGEQFKETTADGRVCMATITMENPNRMKHEQVCDGKKLVMYRDFSDKEMKMTLEGPNVVSTRVYKKID
jgi:hypothetical protein